MSGQYYEDIELGQRYKTPGRTVTETDVVLFAGLSGDQNPIHTDVEFCKSTPFGRPIAHGLLILSILSGLVERTGIQEGTIVAARRMTDLEFTRVVFPGDTIHGEMEALEKKSSADSGLVKFRMTGVNQRGEAVLSLVYEVILRRRTTT